MKQIILLSFIEICCIVACLLNVKRLYDSILFYNEVKQIKKIKKVSAIITEEQTSLINTLMLVRSGGSTSVKATALYKSNDAAIMICACDKRLKKGMNIEIIPCKKRALFALSIQQIKNALLTYTIYSIVFLSITLFVFWSLYSTIVKF